MCSSIAFVLRVVCLFIQCFGFCRCRLQGGLLFRRLLQLPLVSLSGRLVVSKAVVASTGFVFRVVCSFKSCFRFHPVSFSGRPAVSNTVLASSFSGFGPSLFQPLPLTLPPTWHSSGTGQRRGVLDRCLPFNLFRSAACVAAQRPAPEFGVGG